MNSFDSSLRSPEFDRIDSGERQATYDKMARTLHHPDYRADMINHYDELARFNRKFHQLNYPCPPPSLRDHDIIEEMVNAQNGLTSTYSKSKSKSIYESGHFASSDKKVKSMCLTSSRLQKIKQKNLKDQILQKINEGSNPEVERIIAIIAKSLIENGIDFQTVQLALEDVHIRFIADTKSSEFEIEINL